MATVDGTCGPWSPQILNDVALQRPKIVKKHLHVFPIPDTRLDIRHRVDLILWDV